MTFTRKMLALAVGGLLALGAAACGDGDGTTVGEGGPADATSEATPDATVGQGAQVTVTGTVQEVVADRAFTLTDATVDEGAVDTQGGIAVIVSDGEADVSESQQVVVTGALYSVDIADEVEEFEELFGISVDEETLARFEGRHVVLASSVDASA